MKSLVNIGAKCVIEEISIVENSVIGDGCIVEVGGTISEVTINK